MKLFQPGDKYELSFSTPPRAGAVAGYVEIISIERIPESEMQFQESGINGCSNAYCGEISFIVYSESTNRKIKKATLTFSRCSREWADEYRNGEMESEWFSPTKRSYNAIFSSDKKV